MFKVRLDTNGAQIEQLAKSKTDVRKRRFQKRKTADAVMLDNFAIRYGLNKPVEKSSSSLSSPSKKEDGSDEHQIEEEGDDGD